MKELNVVKLSLSVKESLGLPSILIMGDKYKVLKPKDTLTDGIYEILFRFNLVMKNDSASSQI